MSIPLLASFHRRLKFNRHFKPLLFALISTAILFLIWDEIFTRQGIWGFNDRYITGFKIGALPVEEILFFFCIPFACVFTYYSLGKIKRSAFGIKGINLIYAFLGVLFIVSTFAFPAQRYTQITFLITGTTLLLSNLALSKEQQSRFLVSYLILLIPFFITNGVLTGSWIPEEVVWYNDSEHLGIRVGTVPINDMAYMLALLLMNVSLFEWFRSRG